MWKGIAQLMYLLSHQTFWFNAIDSFHVAVEDPATEWGRGWGGAINTKYVRLLSRDEDERHGV